METGKQVSRRRIGRIMKQEGLVSNYTTAQFKPHKNTCNESKTENILNRQFDGQGYRDVVVSDLTYVRVGTHWNYICVLVDLYNREIIGYSAGEHKTCYGNKKADEAAKEWTDGEGNWEYLGSGTTKSVKSGEMSEKGILFKPYLVLNGHEEEDPARTGRDADGNLVASDLKYQYVAQCRDRVIKNAGGDESLWESVRLKHLSRYRLDDTSYGNLDEGIGFLGLIKDTVMTTGAKCTDTDIAESLAKSGRMADYVAGKMGYPCWQSLIFDLSPKGLFSFGDMVDAVVHPERYTLENRFRLYAGMGMLDLVSGGEPVAGEKQYGVSKDGAVPENPFLRMPEAGEDGSHAEPSASGTMDATDGKEPPQNSASTNEELMAAARERFFAKEGRMEEKKLRAVAHEIISGSGLKFQNHERAVKLCVGYFRKKGW